MGAPQKTITLPGQAAPAPQGQQQFQQGITDLMMALKEQTPQARAVQRIEEMKKNYPLGVIIGRDPATGKPYIENGLETFMLSQGQTVPKYMEAPQYRPGRLFGKMPEMKITPEAQTLAAEPWAKALGGEPLGTPAYLKGLYTPSHEQMLAKFGPNYGEKVFKLTGDYFKTQAGMQSRANSMDDKTLEFRLTDARTNVERMAGKTPLAAFIQQELADPNTAEEVRLAIQEYRILQYNYDERLRSKGLLKALPGAEVKSKSQKQKITQKQYDTGRTKYSNKIMMDTYDTTGLTLKPD